MLAIAVAAGAASFRHVHDVAAAHGQPGWLAWTDAVTLELASIAAGLDLRRRKRVGKSVGFPATALTVAVALSLSAQVVEAEQSMIGWLSAALPALGFLSMVKMALGRADPGPDPKLGRPGRGPGLLGADADHVRLTTDRPGPVHADRGRGFVGPGGTLCRRGSFRTRRRAQPREPRRPTTRGGAPAFYRLRDGPPANSPFGASRRNETAWWHRPSRAIR
ncbi:DUF2637 domain-containing protein [Hamadaea flava]|uniref:DUF2637 domain-containing protein n=1 Tax=Hamadaea flava TaxID=1742688 RepID=A0ABV8M463_9ACTN|nr:DUF2637 domain-containing protein [Hamadaea flava]